MKQLLKNADIVTPAGILSGHSLLIEKGYITAVASNLTDENAAVTDFGGDILSPGFIDIQVNGGGGVFFNDDPCVATIQTIGQAHQKYGTTGFLPTFISDDLSKMAIAIKAVQTAIDEKTPGVMGIHLEGPFLNPVKKGVHNAAKFKKLDADTLELLTSLTNGLTLVTLAPEQTEPELIASLASKGVIVSAGHTDATYEETQSALEVGMTGFTHLYNAMTGLNSRAPGVVGAALSHSGSFAGIIVDGFHVHPASVKAAINAKGYSHMMLVTDAMSCVGTRDKAFKIAGVDITVENGKCTTPDGTLAGSDLDMISAVNNTVDWLNIPLGKAIEMASLSPAAFLGLSQSYGSIEIGKKASLIRVGKDKSVVASWIDGEKVNF